MALVTPGNGATITANTAEKFLPAAIWLLQALENDPTRNPSGANNVTSSMSDDSQSLSGTCSFFATVADDAQGRALLECVDYLTVPAGASTHWTAGTGGTISSSTIQGAIFEATRLIDNIENQATKNPQAKKTISYRIESAAGSGTSNVSVSITITNFPLAATRSPDGSQTITGKDYLL